MVKGCDRGLHYMFPVPPFTFSVPYKRAGIGCLVRVYAKWQPSDCCRVKS